MVVACFMCSSTIGIVRLHTRTEFSCLCMCAAAAAPTPTRYGQGGDSLFQNLVVRQVQEEVKNRFGTFLIQTYILSEIPFVNFLNT